MENKRKEAIEKYSESIKGQFDYTVESAHITGFMVGYDTFDKTNLSMTAESIDEIIKKPLSKDEVDKINNLLEDKMREATQKELLENIRDEAAEKYHSENRSNWGPDFAAGFEGSEDIRK